MTTAAAKDAGVLALAYAMGPLWAVTALREALAYATGTVIGGVSVARSPRLRYGYRYRRR